MTDVDWAPIFLVLLVSTTAVQSQIAKGPTNALKKVGDNVTLECVTDSKNCDQIEWKKMEGAQSPKDVYRDGIGMINRDIFPTQRYSVTSTGGCSLTITQLNISDSGRFSCVTLTVSGGEEARSSILVVIDVTEECQSNVTNNELSQNDGYSFSTAVNVPAKSVEPSNVTLSFQNKADYEKETMDYSQSQTLKTTLIGFARKADITQRVCIASLPPNTANDFDRTTAILNVCTTQQLNVSYPVENIVVSPPGPYHKDSRVTCTADGHPSPTFKWTNLKTGDVVDGDTLVIKGEAGDKYTCTATNIIKGKTTSLNIMIEVFSPPEPGCGPGCLVAVILIVIIIIPVLIWLVGWKCGWWPLWFCFPCSLKKDGIDITGLCCTCCTCFSIAFCAICTCCTYFACCIDNKDRKTKEIDESAAPTEVIVSSKPAEPVTNSTTTVPEKPVTNSTTTVPEKPLTNSTTTVPEKPLTNSTTTVSEKPLTNSTTTVSEKPATNSTTTVSEKPLTEVVDSSKAAESLTNSTATGPQKPPRVSYSAPMDLILTSQTEAGTSSQ